MTWLLDGDGSPLAWTCPECPWEQRAHSVYGWADHNDRAVWVHENILCSGKAL